MFRDKDSTIVNVGDTVLLGNGCLCFIRGFIEYDLAVEVVLEDKLSYEVKIVQLKDILKIS